MFNQCSPKKSIPMRDKLIHSVYTARNNSVVSKKPKPTELTKIHPKLPKFSPLQQNTPKNRKVVAHSKTVSMKIDDTHRKGRCLINKLRETQQKCKNGRDSSESFMKDLELSGNDDIQEINFNILQTSQELGRKIEKNVEDYLNNTLLMIKKEKQIKRETALYLNYIDFDLNDDCLQNSSDFKRKHQKILDLRYHRKIISHSKIY